MKTQITSILIPTDFSELSESALKVGLAIAKRQSADITLLHVVDMISVSPPPEVLLCDTGLVPDSKLTMSTKVTELAGNIQKRTGVKITGKVLYGIPGDRICQYAVEENISLIVMGAHGISGIREFFIGSEAFRVIRNATCPVMTIPGNWQKTDFEKVLFPVRLKPGMLNKYFYALPILEKNNSEVMLLGLADQKKSDDLKEVTLLMEKLKVQLYTDKILFQSSLTASKDFPVTIIDTAIEFEADLIILSANIDYNLKTAFVGPFAQQVVNHSHLPVLSIKPAGKLEDSPSSFELAEKWGQSIVYPKPGI
jgi:nucleotide-binding universal stress UspA family protein